MLLALVPQTREALVSIAQDEHTPFALSNKISLFASVTVLAFCAWYFTRGLLYVRYWNTPRAIGHRLERRSNLYRRWTPRVLGVLPLISVIAVYLYESQLNYALYCGGVLMAYLIFVLGRRKLPGCSSSERLHRNMPPATFRWLLALLILSFVLLIIFWIWKVAAPSALGAAAIVFFAAASWIAFGDLALIYPTYHYRLPSLMAVMLVLAVVFGFWNDNHAVRTLPAEKGWDKRPPISEHYRRWLQHRRELLRDPARPYPVFVIAAEGGGIRAAYWTTSVLARIEAAYPGFACHIFAVSGISGGSLGAAVFAAEIADRIENKAYACNRFDNPPLNLLKTTRRILGQDFLSPTLAGALFPDLMQRFVPFGGRFAFFPDRAAYLEQAWEHAWKSQTKSNRFAESFLDLWATDAHQYAVPSLFLNGTWVESGNRNVTSNLNTGSSPFVNADDMLARLQNPIALSTAVHMSARFAYMSPAGTVHLASTKRYVVDGGYFDNTGASTALEIISAMRNVKIEARPGVRSTRNIKLAALIISNNVPDDDSLFPLMLETLAPPRALFNARTARGELAERLLKQARGYQVRTLELSAPEKVPLGWMLSERTRKRIDNEVDVSTEIKGVGCWLHERRPCG
ncbi:MAG: patatin-like phospholipase family protein [Gammaproteobacteria bacterium]